MAHWAKTLGNTLPAFYDTSSPKRQFPWRKRPRQASNGSLDIGLLNIKPCPISQSGLGGEEAAAKLVSTLVDDDSSVGLMFGRHDISMPRLPDTSRTVHVAHLHS